MNFMKSILKISIGITLVITVLKFVFTGFDYSHFTNVESLSIIFSHVVVLTVVNVVFFHLMAQKFDWKNQGKKRLVIGIVGSVFLTMLAFIICRIIYLVYIDKRYPINEFLDQQDLGKYLITFLLVVAITLFFQVFNFYKNVQENKVKEQQIIAGTASAKFDALKNQLDPHFLFNSLNVLTSLIDENPETAQKFTTSLSKVYRYVLEQKNKELVSVEEELKFAETYIGLLKMRFENSIQFHVSKAISNPEAKIIPLSLQLLLENAVKHNMISEENPLIINIYEKDGNLMVKNNLQHKNVLHKSSGIGLLNIKQRYDLLTSREVLIHKNEQYFEVGLPMLTKQISIVTQENLNEPEDMDYQKMKRAQTKVKKIKGFYGNITSYIIVIPFLAFVNYFTTGFEFPWVLFPMFGWGIGICFHYMEAFDYSPFLGKNWEERKIRELMNKK